MRQSWGAATALWVVLVGCADERAIRHQVVRVPASASHDEVRVAVRLPAWSNADTGVLRVVASPESTVDVVLVWSDTNGVERIVDGASWGGVETLDGLNPAAVSSLVLAARTRGASRESRISVEVGLRPRWLGEETEPNDSGREAQPLLAGQQVTGSVGWRADRDCFRLPQGLAAVGWTIAVSGPPAPWLDVVLDLEDGEQNILESWDRRRGGAGERVTRAPTAAANIEVVCVRAVGDAHAREVYFLEITPLRSTTVGEGETEAPREEGSGAL